MTCLLAQGDVMNISYGSRSYPALVLVLIQTPQCLGLGLGGLDDNTAAGAERLFR